MSKRFAVIGKGTAGAISALHILKRLKEADSLHIFYDEDQKALPVGEGTTPTFPDFLHNYLQVTRQGFEKNLSGTIKTGIMFEGWGQKDYWHDFTLMRQGVHFDASKFQEQAEEKLNNDPRVTYISQRVEANDIDADYVWDCGGGPASFEGYKKSEFICVDSALVTQCYWEKPEFFHTKAIAAKWGWIFFIPLQNRCSVGYLFNRSISNVTVIQDDVKEVFERYSLIPSDETRHIEFSSYVKNELITDRVCYSGNKGFFLEPLEALTIDGIFMAVMAGLEKAGLLHPSKNLERLNDYLHDVFRHAEHFIMLHYAAGSKYDSAFWDFAKEKADRCLSVPKFTETSLVGQQSYEIVRNGLGLN